MPCFSHSPPGTERTPKACRINGVLSTTLQPLHQIFQLVLPSSCATSVQPSLDSPPPAEVGFPQLPRAATPLPWAPSAPASSRLFLRLTPRKENRGAKGACGTRLACAGRPGTPGPRRQQRGAQLTRAPSCLGSPGPARLGGTPLQGRSGGEGGALSPPPSPATGLALPPLLIKLQLNRAGSCQG